MVNHTEFEGRIPATVGLALLESLRDVDTPADPEALAESDLPLNLQRRLGLSGVVLDQIRRYESRRGDRVPAAEVASLFELIGRRADASRIFLEAGQRIARSDLAGRRAAARIGTRLLPRSLRERRALQRAGRIARHISPGADTRLQHRPHGLLIERGLPARASGGGAGCAVLAGALQYVFSEFRAGDLQVVHPRCEGRAEGCCEWVIQSGDPAHAGIEICDLENFASRTAPAGFVQPAPVAGG